MEHDTFISYEDSVALIWFSYKKRCFSTTSAARTCVSGGIWHQVFYWFLIWIDTPHTAVPVLVLVDLGRLAHSWLGPVSCCSYWVSAQALCQTQSTSTMAKESELCCMNPVCYRPSGTTGSFVCPYLLVTVPLVRLSEPSVHVCLLSANVLSSPAGLYTGKGYVCWV